MQGHGAFFSKAAWDDPLWNVNEAAIFGFVQPLTRPAAVASLYNSTYERHLAGAGAFDSYVKTRIAHFENRAPWPSDKLVQGGSAQHSFQGPIYSYSGKRPSLQPAGIAR